MKEAYRDGVSGRSQSVLNRKRPSTDLELKLNKSKSAHLPQTAAGNGPSTRILSDSESRQNSALSSPHRKRFRKRSVHSAATSASIPGSEHEEDRPPSPKPAWEQFSEHIKTFSTTGSSYSAASPEFGKSTNSLMDRSGSDICKKILKDMKDQLERKRAKELLVQQLREAEASDRQRVIDALQSDDDSDLEDSDDDEDNEEKRLKRLRAEAQRYWGIIKRDVQEKIRIRKEKNPAGGTWNTLRSQLRALTRANNVRQELYEKYGIIPRAGSKVPEDSMKPTLSINIKEVVNRFQSFQVRKLKVTFA